MLGFAPTLSGVGAILVYCLIARGYPARCARYELYLGLPDAVGNLGLIFTVGRADQWHTVVSYSICF